MEFHDEIRVSSFIALEYETLPNILKREGASLKIWDYPVDKIDVIGDGKQVIGERITVGMVQSLERRLDIQLVNRFGTIGYTIHKISRAELMQSGELITPKFELIPTAFSLVKGKKEKGDSNI